MNRNYDLKSLGGFLASCAWAISIAWLGSSGLSLAKTVLPNHHAFGKHSSVNTLSNILNSNADARAKPANLAHLNKNEALKELSLLSQKGAISEARVLVKQLLEANDKDADVHLAAGDFYRSIGSLALAIDQYNEALKLSGHNAKSYLGLAQIYLTNNLDSRACACAYQACLLAPESTEARLVYVEALLKTDRVRQADQELAKLLAQPGQITNANIAYAAYQVYRRRAQFASAENYLNQAIALDPKQNQWLVERAELCQLRKDYQGARNALRLALVADPYSISALYQLGLCLERDFQDYDGAIIEFEKLLKIDPDYVDAVAQIDLCRERKNDLAGQLKLELWRQIEGFDSVFKSGPQK